MIAARSSAGTGLFRAAAGIEERQPGHLVRCKRAVPAKDDALSGYFFPAILGSMPSAVQSGV